MLIGKESWGLLPSASCVCTWKASTELSSRPRWAAPSHLLRNRAGSASWTVPGREAGGLPESPLSLPGFRFPR